MKLFMGQSIPTRTKIGAVMSPVFFFFTFHYKSGFYDEFNGEKQNVLAVIVCEIKPFILVFFILPRREN